MGSAKSINFLFETLPGVPAKLSPQRILQNGVGSVATVVRKAIA